MAHFFAHLHALFYRCFSSSKIHFRAWNILACTSCHTQKCGMRRTNALTATHPRNFCLCGLSLPCCQCLGSTFLCKLYLFIRLPWFACLFFLVAQKMQHHGGLWHLLAFFYFCT